MLLQLLGFAVALTMTATASAKAVSPDLPTGQACETSLRTEPKRAYYDPQGEYGTTAGLIYNYTSLTFEIFDTTNQTIEFLPNTTTQIADSNGNYRPIWDSAPAGSYSTNEEAQEAIANCNYVFYKNGVEIADQANVWMVVPQGQYVVRLNNSHFYDTTAYYWLFDKQLTEEEIYEAEIGGIFTEVGNVVTAMAETLTKPWDGIVNIFYDTTNNEVTDLGILCLVSLGCAVAVMGFAIAIRLFKQRG